MFKTAVSLEETGRTQIVALDKTGTITSGEPKVTDMIPAEGVTEQELLTLAYALEQKSEHPLAHAILVKAQESCMDHAPETEDFQAVPGNGLTGKLGTDMLAGGNLQFISQVTGENGSVITAEIRKKAEELAEEGKTPLFFSRNGKLIGIIAVADVIKEDSPQAVRELQNMGIHVVMLTGDTESAGREVAKELQMDYAYTNLMPEDKLEQLEDFMGLQDGGERLVCVGDGINDAPVLARADVEIAMGALGSAAAIEAADIVLMDDELPRIVDAIKIARETLRVVSQNITFAMVVKVLILILAAVGYFGMWEAIAAEVGVMFVVILNAVWVVRYQV